MMSSCVLVLLVLSSVFGVLEAQNGRTECNTDTTRKCRKNIEDVIGGNGNFRQLDLEDQCWRMRQSFDCVLWQTSMCLKQDEQDRNGDIIQKGWRFLDGYCETFKNWWTKTCYRTDRLKRCEGNLGTKTRSTDYESCKTYLRFRECATLAIETECNSDDQRLLGVYLMDKGQQRSWKCPRDSESYSREPVKSPLASNTREVNSRDTMLGDSPSFDSCLYNAQRSTQECLVKLENIKKEARDLVDEEEVERKICCGLTSYEDCVIKELRKYCADEAPRAVRQLVTSVKGRTGYSCEKTITCSGPLSTTVTHAIVIGGILATFIATVFV